MKTKVTFLFLMSFLCLHFTLPAQTLSITNTSCDTKLLKVEDIQSNTTLVGSTNLRVFWEFGDGNYKIEDLNTGSLITSTSIQHVYAAEANDVTPTVTLTRLSYHEVEPPIRSAFSSFDVDGATCTLTADLNDYKPSSFIDFEPSGALVEGTGGDEHEVTLIISYDGTSVSCDNTPGAISFSYNPAVLAPFPDPTTLSGIKYYTEDGITMNQLVQTASASTAQLNWTFSENEWGRIFIRMKVIGEIGDDPGIAVVYSNLGKCSTGNTISYNEAVGRSHDPNNITTPALFECEFSPTGNVIYTIKFQNDGNGPATNVVVRNWIPEVFNLGSIKTLYPQGLVGVPIPFPAGSREAIWELNAGNLRNNQTLRGLTEPQYGTSIFYDETIDSVVYEIEFLPGVDFFPCDAVVNEANIVFDQNPPIYTPPHILRFECSISSPIASLDSCVLCEEFYDFEVTTLRLEKNQPVTLDFDEDVVLAGFLGTGYTYRWYPEQYLDIVNETDFHPQITPQDSITYYLVASGGENLDCRRKIVKIPVKLKKKGFPFIYVGIGILIILGLIIFLRPRPRPNNG